ncbi:hypothetical protein Ddye_026371 [Dipteronia dyeriana]|uniref:Uncharacterized protein n=1 Tax=Dipteronia dyeriana TaxID=168575 RepID=A0AAD9TM57_9ROSI|nr:hypothetical protein Ddye_026371 [Dipteronia dyeriana]
MDDSNLLGLLVETMKNGLCDANGSLSKLNVENFILPRLNVKTRFPKTYSNYISRMKWFNNQYNKINEPMCDNFDLVGTQLERKSRLVMKYRKNN